MLLRSRLALAGLLALGCRAPEPSTPDCESPPAQGEPPRVEAEALELLQPGCLARVPGTGRFACVRLSATPSEDGVQDLGGESMNDTLARVRERGAEIELDVIEVAPGVEEELWIAGIDPRLTGAAARQQREGIGMLLAARGFLRPLIGTLSLEVDAAALNDDPIVVEARSEVTGLVFRYECHLHEGDASFEYYATLAVVCAPGQAPRVILEQLGGPLARLSFSDDGRFGVISIEHQDGGEGYVDVTWLHHAFALDGVC
jgi:hypothetical protein